MADVIRRMQAGGIGPTDVTCGAISDGIYAPDAAARLLNLVEQQPDRPLSEAYRAIVRVSSLSIRTSDFLYFTCVSFSEMALYYPRHPIE